jgi:threonyl-tRNA synthetase
MKIPLMAIVGMKEVESGTLSVRSKKLGDLGSFDVEALLSGLVGAIKEGEEFEEVGRKEEKEKEKAVEG